MKTTAEHQLLLHTNALRNLAAKEPINSNLRELEQQIREDIIKLIEEKRELEQTIETLINESDEGIDYI